jgi:CBS domain-containing protein
MADSTHTMSVREIMSVNVITIPPNSPISKVAVLMRDMDIGAIIVVDRERPVGVVTEADIVRRVVASEMNPKDVVASEVMSSPLIHVTPDTPLTEVMRVMARSNIRRVAVLKQDSLAGIVTSRDILRWSPELIDILVESLRLREESRREQEAEDDELVTYGGICDICGEYSNDLSLEDGEYVCETCRTPT